MKLRRIALCVASALSLIGCANVAQQGAPASSYRFDYTMAQRTDGVIRAFDDGKQTIIQFVDLEKSRPMFTSASGAPIEYEVRGQYALLPTILPQFAVRTTSGGARFEYTGTPAPRVVTDPAPIAAPAVTTRAVPAAVAAPPLPATTSVAGAQSGAKAAPSAKAVVTPAAAAVAKPVTTAPVTPVEVDRRAAQPAKKEEGRAAGAGVAPKVMADQAKPTPSFDVLPTDTLLVPVLVRWAESGGMVAVLNGRKVTSATLPEVARHDLPLTPEARAVRGANAADAIVAMLKTYAGYRTDVALTAQLQAPNVLAITSTKPASTTPQASVAPPPQTPTRAAAAQAAAPVQEKSWDDPARKAAGALPQQWDIKDSQSLRAVVERWAQQAGLRVQWESSHDFPLTEVVKTGAYSGTFKEALGQLAGRLGQLSMPIAMKFSSSGLVLRVIDANAS